MYKSSLFGSLAAILLTTSGAFAAERYEFDKSHTAIAFSINHLGFSNTIGRFELYEGFFEFDEKNPQNSKVEVIFDPKGVNTVSKELEEHLQEKAFFNSTEYPTITFKSTKVEVTGEKQGKITGDFTMLGVTKPLVLDVTFNKADYHPMTKKYVAGFSATTSLKRSEFGMTEYVPMVGDEVKISIEVEGVNSFRAEKKDASPAQ